MRMQKGNAMSSKLRSLKRNIKKLEKMGFIVPTYMKQIKTEKTASKYSQKKMMELSKFKETYKGKERIVSGERGRELILRERAQKGAETRRRKRENESNFSIPPVYSRENQALALDMRLKQYFNQFGNKTLGQLFSDIYEEAKAESGDEMAFLGALLDVQSETVEKVQQALLLKYPNNSGEEMQEAGNDWLNFLTSNSPSMSQRKALGDAEDKG